MEIPWPAWSWSDMAEPSSCLPASVPVRPNLAAEEERLAGLIWEIDPFFPELVATPVHHETTKWSRLHRPMLAQVGTFTSAG
jgi:hypothetical protein